MSEEAAELIGKIAAEGVDQYVSDLNRAGDAADALGERSNKAFDKMNHALSSSGGLSSSLKGASSGMTNLSETGASSFSSGLSLAETGVSALSTAIGVGIERIAEFAVNLVTQGIDALEQFIQKSMDAAAEFDKFSQTLTALEGDKKKGQVDVTFIQQFQKGKGYKTDDLMQAATQLEAANLNMEKSLPVASRLGSIYEGDAGKLMQAVKAMDALKEGNFAMARRTLRNSFKVDDQDWAAHGIDSTAKGGPTQSIAQQMDALNAISKEKFSGVQDALADSPMAKMVDATNSFSQAMVKAGNVFNQAFMPVIEKITRFVDYLVNSGMLTKITKGFTDLFNGKSFGDGLTNILAWVAATLMNLPEMLKHAWDWFSGLFKGVDDIMTGIVNGIQAGFVLAINLMKGSLEDVLNLVRRGVLLLAEGANQVLSAIHMPTFNLDSLKEDWKLGPDLETAPFKNMADFFGQTFGGLGDSIFGDSLGNISKDHDALMKGLAGYKPDRSEANKDRSDEPWTMTNDPHLYEQRATNEHLKTLIHETAKQTDLKKYALGGGDLGALGIMPSEYYAAQARGEFSNAPIPLDVTGADRHLKAFVTMIAAQVVLANARKNPSH